MTDRIEAFWNRAILKARINQLEVVTGPDRDSALMPPTWSMDDASVAAALKNGTTVLASLATQHEVLPEVGGLSILLWQDGTPAALLRTTEVSVHTQAELDGDGEDAGDWAQVRDSAPEGVDIVIERFRVIADNA
ncbi:hypothetical protein [Flaviflexus salsibiostraticola]|uniref:hypothetical protein n=1 Tax=Flaviflexus salsibiostraticola TaxID=1282737 RepID=UPI0013DE1E79|nr:hypothetical protein [Flaviflexus salsibiostraticola]